jgi:hypothetical protein
MKYGDTTYLPAGYWASVRIGADGHWRWMGQRCRDGYGLTWTLPRMGKQRAHRVMYAAATGTLLPAGWRWQVDHICKQRDCVRPDHLQLLSQTEHWQKDVGPSIARRTRERRYCKYKHDKDAVGRTDSGGCLLCDQRNKSMARAKAKGARKWGATV